MRVAVHLGGRSLGSALVIALIGSLLATWAANPSSAATSGNITLELRHVSLSQAAAALQSAAGTTVEVGARPADSDPALLRSLSWKNLRVEQALRDLCRAFQVHCTRSATGYRLSRAPFPPSDELPLPPPEARSFRTEIGRVSVMGTHREPPADRQPGITGIDLLAEQGTPSFRFTGLQNVIAQDDLGNYLTNAIFRRPRWMSGETFPDQMGRSIEFPGVNSKARKLVWIRGDVYGHQASMMRELEVPWAEAVAGTSRQVGRFQIIVRPLGGAAAGSGQHSGQQGIMVSIHYIVERGEDLLAQPEVNLLDAAGNDVASPGGGGFTRDGSGTVIDRSFLLTPPSAVPIKVEISLNLEGPPRRLMAFQLNDVPLPPAPAEPEAALALLPPPVYNPRITLALANVTLPETLAALNAASGLTSLCINVDGTSATREGMRGTFRWKDTPFGRALREVCAAFQLSCRPDEMVFRLTPQPAPIAPAPANNWAVFQKDGTRLFCAPEILRDQRGFGGGGFGGIGFGGGVRFGGEAKPYLSLSLAAELDGVDPFTIAGVDHVIVGDRRGNVFSAQRGGGGGLNLHPGSWYPDCWSDVALQVQFPDDREHRLDWIEGELLAYRQDVHDTLNIPFVLGPPGQDQHVGPLAFQVESYPPRPSDHAGDPDEGPSIELRCQNDLSRQAMYLFAFVGASGRIYLPHGQWRDGERYDIDFPQIAEPVKQVKIAVRYVADPEPFLRFRFDHLKTPSPTGAPQTSFAFPVLVDGKPAVLGSLRLGLAVDEGPNWGPLRWQTAEVGLDGTVEFTGLQPGRYRCVRRYRPEEGAFPLMGGAWQNETVLVTIAEGKNVELPPLSWSGRRSSRGAAGGQTPGKTIPPPQ